MARIRASRILRFIRRTLRNDQLVVGLVALMVGALVAAAVIALRESISLVQTLFFGTGSERLYDTAAALPWWRRLMAPVLGGLAVGVFVHLVLGKKQPPGMAEVIDEAETRTGCMPLWRGVRTAFSAILSIGAGASLGREGPAVHLGTTLGSWLARRLRLQRDLSHALLGCGAAAAVAASFNAPIAGALFAQEVVTASFAPAAFAPVVIAAAAATAVSRGWFGDHVAFVVPSFHMASLAEFPAFMGLGILAALMTALFLRLLGWTEAGLGRMTPQLLPRLILGGLVVGAIAVAFPQILGGGYQITDDALKGQVPLAALAALALAKLAATTISLGSGFPGGVFGPSLAMGALLGGAYGMVLDMALPLMISSSGAYAMVGMGAMAAAVLGAPVSTTLIVFELTADYELTVHTLVASAVASAFAQRLTGYRSYFHYRLEEQKKLRNRRKP